MLVGLTNVTFEFGARTIVRNATWHIHPNERIGLIGYNGTGKSTLLKVLVGEYSPSAGTVEQGRDVTIGYLHQDLLSQEIDKSILEVAMDAFERARSIQHALQETEKLLETDASNEALLEKYAHLLHDFEMAGGYNMEHQAAEILHGLGFETVQFSKPFRQFSGGWRMRVLLAKMILQHPDVLLLDEPTNHLDLPSIEWLEKYLQHYPGSVVIVSHDKFFLNRMVKKIVELYQQELHIYSGNYDFYEREKAERIELQKRAFENQQEYIRQQERFIERFRAKATKAAQAQSAMKRLEKLDIIEDVELERPNIRINFLVDCQPGKVICSLKQVGKRYGPLTILDGADAEIYRGDKIALIGANGKGKSTLLRIIAGTEGHDGVREWGYNVQEAFYAQHQLEALDVNHTLLEEMNTSRAGKTELEYRSLLGCFLFSGDDVEKKIRVLSGGEKARVALAKTIVSKANFLMLDEPTNHLDMHSVELLIEALNRYEGSMILVSHDRYFISRVANVFWEIIDHQIAEYRGTYEEYVLWKEKMAAQKGNILREEPAPTMVAVEPPAPKTGGPQQGAPAPGKSRPINKELQKDFLKQQRLFEKTEQQLSEVKHEMERLEALLAAPETYSDKEKFRATEAAYAAAQANHNNLQSTYESVFEKLMELEEALQS